MLPNKNIQGKSLPLNIVAIILNLAGVYLLIYDFLFELSTVNVVMGYIFFFVGLIALFFFKGFFMFSYVSRSLVGGLFIVSGLIKANDPLGFAYKLEEYFAENALNFPSLEEYVVHISIFICIVEIILGAALVLGAKIKLTSWSLLLMMGFFLWLTHYTASCNDAMAIAMQNGEEFSKVCVTDCGCFGDAFRGSFGRPLNPWESFSKDVVLLYLILIIFFNQWRTKINTANENLVMIATSLVVVSFFCWVFSWWFPLLFASLILFGALLFGNGIRVKYLDRAWTMAVFVLLVTLLFSMYTVNYLPVKDYRPYAVGNDLREMMSNGEPPVVKKVFVIDDKENGKTIELTQEEYVLPENKKYWDTDTYPILESKEKVLKEGIPTSIQDFSPQIRYEFLSEDIKNDPVVAALFQEHKDEYYHDIAIVKYIADPANSYTDTIPLDSYSDTLYPDSTFKVMGKGTFLIDQNRPFKIDMKEYILTRDKIMLIVMRKLDMVNTDVMADLVSLANGVKENGIPVIILTSSTQEEINAFNDEHKINAPFMGMDDIELKIIIRSNPGVLLLSNAIVLDKWPSKRLPKEEKIMQVFEK